MFYQLFYKLDQHYKFDTARAHCDIPCGIYDPITAQIAALTTVRMIDLITDLESKHTQHNAETINSLARYVAVKEEHAEKAKHEIRVIMGDYIKAPHMEKHPELMTLVHKIMQLGSKVRQTVDRELAVQYVDAINQFTEIFWETKGITTKRAKAPYPPALELVYPNL